jgi:GNAT superfamily N-acetyltransferase
MTSVTTRHATLNDINDHTVERISKLINDVYDQAESDLWKSKGGRVDNNEVSRLINNNNLILAELDGVIIGSVKYEPVDQSICEFGMLVADENYRGKGIGTLLVNAAENWAIKNGYKTMQLELLTPRHWKNDSKEFLKKWYSRIGYKPTHTMAFEQHFSERINDMATECDFTVWLKNIS